MPKPLRLSQSRLPHFLAAGGLSTLLHWLIMGTMVHFGVDPRLSTASGATAGLMFNYVAQHRFAFASSLAHQTTLPRYLAATSVGWTLNLICFSSLALVGLEPPAAQFLATALVTAANYFFATRFVFHEKTMP